MRISQKSKGLTIFLIVLAWGVILIGGEWLGWAADNTACLKCHKNPRLSKGKKDGSLLSLYVNEALFKSSVHGAADLSCTDCHQEARPDFHPAEGFPEVNCANCHPEAVEAFKKTTHGMMWASGIEKAPKCHDCHTAHYMRKMQDPQSSVAVKNLSRACAQCHEEAQPAKGFLAALATYRLKGHPKTGLDYRYDTQNCANCHPDNTGHPLKAPAASSCVKCHDKSYVTPLLSGPIHFKPSWERQPIPYLMQTLYGVGVAAIVVGIIGAYAFRIYRQRKKDSEKTST